MIAVLLALAGAPIQRPPTIGDTVWVGATSPAPARMIVRPQTWDLGDLGQVLGPPDVAYNGDSVTVRYPVVFWYPGDHEVRVPGPILVSPEGASDTLPARPVMVRIGSVLPPDTAPARLEPRPAARTVAQSRRSALPVIVLLLVAGLGVGLIALLWRARLRRRHAAVPAPAIAPIPARELLDRWTGAGELKAALDGWSHLVETAAARLDDPATRERIAAWVAAADRAGFANQPSRRDLERLIADAGPLLALAERRRSS